MVGEVVLDQPVFCIWKLGFSRDHEWPASLQTCRVTYYIISSSPWTSCCFEHIWSYIIVILSPLTRVPDCAVPLRARLWWSVAGAMGWAGPMCCYLRLTPLSLPKDKLYRHLLPQVWLQVFFLCADCPLWAVYMESALEQHRAHTSFRRNICYTVCSLLFLPLYLILLHRETM